MAAPDAPFRDEQRGVAIRMALALATTVAVVAAALIAGRASDLAHRVQMAAAVALVVIAWLAASIANVARLRFFSPDDIAGGGRSTASAPVRDANAILQNTLEQAVLAIAAYGILAITLARSATLIVALGCLFAIGRALFWIGYARGAPQRALGFALTFYPSVAALLVAAVAIVTA